MALADEPRQLVRRFGGDSLYMTKCIRADALVICVTDSPGRLSYRVGVRRQRGFTLLELMATVAVVAVILTAGVPSFLTVIQNNRITTQTNELVSAINLARAEAVKRGRNVQVVVELRDAGWAATVAVVGAGGDRVRVIDRSSSAIAINEAATVTFSPTGVPVPMAMVTFELQPQASCSGMQGRRVAVAVSGQITTTRQACG